MGIWHGYWLCVVDTLNDIILVASLANTKTSHSSDLERCETAWDIADVDMTRKLIQCDQRDHGTILAGDEELRSERLLFFRHLDCSLGSKHKVCSLSMFIFDSLSKGEGTALMFAMNQEESKTGSVVEVGRGICRCQKLVS